MSETTTERFWLISGELMRKVRAALLADVEAQESRCGETGCMCDLHGFSCSQRQHDLLHDFDSGCHTTDEVPSDWR